MPSEDILKRVQFPQKGLVTDEIVPNLEDSSLYDQSSETSFLEFLPQ